MAKAKKAVGRPKSIESDDDRKVSVTASLTVGNHKKVQDKYGSLTNAVNEEIIPKLRKKSTKK